MIDIGVLELFVQSAVKLENDDILGGIMQELESPQSHVSTTPLEIPTTICSKQEMTSRYYNLFLLIA